MRVHAAPCPHSAQDLLEQFLTNVDKPEYDKVWLDVAGAKGAGVNRTRNRKDAVISAANFLKKFLARKAGPAKPSKAPVAAAPVPVEVPLGEKPPVFDSVGVADPFQFWEGEYSFDDGVTDGPGHEAPKAESLLMAAKERKAQASLAPVPDAAPGAKEEGAKGPAVVAPVPAPAPAPLPPALSSDALDDLLLDTGRGADVGLGEDFGFDMMDDEMGVNPDDLADF